jgi:hypothetical protein
MNRFGYMGPTYDASLPSSLEQFDTRTRMVSGIAAVVLGTIASLLVHKRSETLHVPSVLAAATLGYVIGPNVLSHQSETVRKWLSEPVHEAVGLQGEGNHLYNLPASLQAVYK